jgi:peroxiredoxin
MTDPTHGALGPGDRAPDFELPAADTEGTVTLADYRRRGSVLLVMLRGLYCPFCRRHISLLRPACETLRGSGIALLGIVIASPDRARTYFRHFPPCFPMAAAPDRAVHRVYGLPEVTRTPELRQDVEDRAAEVLRERGLPVPPGGATAAFRTASGFEMTAEDTAEWQRPLQSVGSFLVGQDGLIRWTRVDPSVPTLPKTEELLSLL